MTCTSIPCVFICVYTKERRRPSLRGSDIVDVKEEGAWRGGTEKVIAREGVLVSKK